MCFYVPFAKAGIVAVRAAQFICVYGERIMKKISAVLMIILLLLPFAVSTQAAFDFNQANKSAAPSMSKSCEGAMSLDRSTGSVMYSKKINEKIPINGTLVRLMTALVAENERKTDSGRATDIDTEKYELLLAGMLLDERENDAEQLALSICETGDEFVALMNSTAKKLGMNDTEFVNYNGENDKNAYTTLNDLLILTDQAYSYANIKTMLKANIYTTSDKEMSFARKSSYSVLDTSSRQYNKYVCFFAATDISDNGFACVFTVSSLSGREVFGAIYESGHTSSEYITNYASDILALQKNAYSDYYQSDLSSVAKSLVGDMSFNLKDGSTAYVSLRVPSDEQTVKLFSSEYGLVMGDSHEDCYIEVNETLLPESTELGQLLIDGKLKCGNDELLNVSLITYKIKTVGGSIKTSDYVLFDLEKGEEQATAQYKKNDWLIVVGIVCLCAVAAVLVSEFIKRKLI